jgi:hypothetical protein
MIERTILMAVLLFTLDAPMKKILIGILFTILPVYLFSQGVRREWNFENDRIGATPRGFTSETGEWRIVSDSTAPSGLHVLTQRAKSSRSTFNLCLNEDTLYTHLDISVRAKAVAGKIDQGGGLIWRAKDGKNYYVAWFNPLDKTYQVCVVENGRSVDLQSAAVKDVGDWRTMAVSVTADRIECYLDGKKLLDVKDATFRESGKIGLLTRSDAQTYFDNLVVAEKH